MRVHPAMVPAEHPLASVRDSFNAIFVEGAAVGDLMFYGRGAGGSPTASAVLGDLIDAAVNRHKGSHASVGALAKAGSARSTRSSPPTTSTSRCSTAPACWPRSPACSATRRVDPLDGAGGPGRRGPPHLHHPRGREADVQATVATSEPRRRRPHRLGAASSVSTPKQSFARV